MAFPLLLVKSSLCTIAFSGNRDSANIISRTITVMIQRSNDLQNDELGMEVIVLSDRMVN
jgi:hypothetical protein